MADDVIRVRGIQGFGFHGVLPEERSNGQQFVVDVALRVDMSKAATSDELTDTVDYAAVARDVLSVIEGEPLNLIEAVGGRVAAAALRHELVREVTVTVHKPSAPVGVPVDDVSVTITRRR